MAKKQNKQPKPQPVCQSPIDRLRNSGGSISINPPDDDSPTMGFLNIKDQLYVIKKRGIYRLYLADDFDPDRTNLRIPSAFQRVIKMDTESELIGRTLLTGEKLFKNDVLQKKVDCDEAMSLTLAITHSLVAMRNTATDLKKLEERTILASDLAIRKDGSLMLPDIGEVEAKCKFFLQQAGHVHRELLEIVKLFYPDQNFRRWFDSVRGFIKESGDENDGFTEFLECNLPILRLVRNARNCVEHPKKSQFVKVMDFYISLDAELITSTIEVIHPDSPYPTTSAPSFMKYITDAMVEIVELMIVFLCGRHIQAVGTIQPILYKIPDDKKQNKHINFGYGVLLNDEIVPFV